VGAAAEEAMVVVLVVEDTSEAVEASTAVAGVEE
jgi:hypothetical protein